VLDDLLCFLPGTRIPGLLEQRSQLLYRGSASGLQCRIGAQEGERRGLVQFAEHFQRDRVIRFEAGRELVDQPGLHLNQCILVARQGFEFLDLFAVRVEPAQILEVSAPGFGQQVGVNGVGLGSRGRSPLLNGPRIDWVDWPSLFQQMSNQQSMGGLHDTCQLVFSSWSGYLLQVAVQLAQSIGTMGNTDRSQLMALFVDAEAHHDDRLPNRYRKTSLLLSFPEKSGVSELLCPYTVSADRVTL